MSRPIGKGGRPIVGRSRPKDRWSGGRVAPFHSIRHQTGNKHHIYEECGFAQTIYERALRALIAQTSGNPMSCATTVTNCHLKNERAIEMPSG